MGRGILSRVGSSDPSRKLDELQSITANLHAILNTREGDSPAADDFGLTDLSDLLHNFPDATQYVLRSIRDTVIKYEPRLKNVRVRAIESHDPLKLAFEITARIDDGDRKGLVRLRTEIGPSGQANVEA